MISSIREAQSLQEAGTVASSQQRFADASRLFDEGLALVGDDYIDENTLDDTGLRLALAKTEEFKGNFKLAAKLKEAVLASRLAVVRQKNGCESAATNGARSARQGGADRTSS